MWHPLCAASTDADLLPELRAAKAAGLPLSVETCPHYLNFAAEDVPKGDTRCALFQVSNAPTLWVCIAAARLHAAACRPYCGAWEATLIRQQTGRQAGRQAGRAVEAGRVPGCTGSRASPPASAACKPCGC